MTEQSQKPETPVQKLKRIKARHRPAVVEPVKERIKAGSPGSEVVRSPAPETPKAPAKKAAAKKAAPAKKAAAKKAASSK